MFNRDIEHYVGNNPVKYVDPDGRINWDKIQQGLDLLGCIPGVGEVADLANAGISIGRGDYEGAALSAVSIIPVFGDILGKGGKVVRAAVKHGDEIAGAVTSFARNSDEVADIGTGIIKNGDEVAKTASEQNPGKSFFDGTFYSDKVQNNMSNGPGEFHSFPDIVENYESYGQISQIVGGDGITRNTLRIPGTYNGRNGYFEFIQESSGEINHRFFKAENNLK